MVQGEYRCVKRNRITVITSLIEFLIRGETELKLHFRHPVGIGSRDLAIRTDTVERGVTG